MDSNKLTADQEAKNYLKNNLDLEHKVVYNCSPTEAFCKGYEAGSQSQSSEIERLRQELDFAQKDRDSLKVKWEANSCTVADLADEADQLKKFGETLKEEISSLKSQLEAAKVDIGEQETCECGEKHPLKYCIHDVDGLAVCPKCQNDAAQEIIFNKLSQITDLRRKLSKKEKDITELKSQLEAKAVDVEDLRKEYDTTFSLTSTPFYMIRNKLFDFFTKHLQTGKSYLETQQDKFIEKAKEDNQKLENQFWGTGKSEAWISTDDESPEIGRIVLFVLRHSKDDVYAGFRAKGGWYAYCIGEESKRFIPNGYDNVKIIKWQPLPKV